MGELVAAAPTSPGHSPLSPVSFFSTGSVCLPPQGPYLGPCCSFNPRIPPHSLTGFRQHPLPLPACWAAPRDGGDWQDLEEGAPSLC